MAKLKTETQNTAVELKMDEISEAAVRDFPSSDATALLIVVIKELVVQERGDEFESEENNINTEGDGAAMENVDLEQANSKAQDAADAEEQPTDTIGDVEGISDTVVTEREEIEIEAQGPENDTGGVSILDEKDVVDMSKSAALPARQVEVTRFIARLLPLDQMEADDWIACMYVVKNDYVEDSAPLDSRFQVGVLPISTISNLSQVIQKAYIPCIHRTSDAAGNLGQNLP